MSDIVATKAPKTPKVTKPTTGWGKGWHLKKEFVAPNGDRYSFGKLIAVESK